MSDKNGNEKIIVTAHEGKEYWSVYYDADHFEITDDGILMLYKGDTLVVAFVRERWVEAEYKK